MVKFPPTVRAVFFDADDTLFHVHPSIGHIYSDHFIRYGIDASCDEINGVLPKIWSGFKSEYENAHNDYETWRTREQEMWFKFIGIVAGEFSPSEISPQMQEEIYFSFARASSRKLYDGIRELLASLRARGIITGVLTNNDERMIQLFDELELQPLFDHLLPTTTLGWKKPSINCFRVVEQRIGCSPSEILYIGDSLEHDVRGAQNAGWHTLWFNPRGRAGGVDPVTSCSTFFEVARLLEE